MGVRVAYPVTAQFSKRVTFIVFSFVFSAFLGLFLFNWFTQAKYQRCTSYSNTTWTASNCAASTLELMETRYTMPLGEVQQDGVGAFPWQLQGFSSSEAGDVDPTVLSVNFTSQALTCSMFRERLSVRLDDGASTTMAWYRCTSPFSVLTTIVDSSKTPFTNQAASRLANTLALYNSVAEEGRQLGASIVNNAAILSVSVERRASGSSDHGGQTTFSTQASLGTTLGAVMIYENSTIAGVARVAALGRELADTVQSVTASDLGNADRTFLTTYICTRCRREYKGAWEIFAILFASIAAVLGPAYAIGIFLAELIFVKPHETAAALDRLQSSARRPPAAPDEDDKKSVQSQPGFSSAQYQSLPLNA